MFQREVQSLIHRGSVPKRHHPSPDFDGDDDSGSGPEKPPDTPR